MPQQRAVADFIEIYDEHLGLVYGYIACRVANRADAEDITQQTFERALVHWAAFDGSRARVTTWLIAIARNLLIDHYRSSGARPGATPLETLAESELPRAPERGTDVGLDPELAAALADLSDRERELVGLRYFADLSGLEIAAVTGLTLANVRQILSRSRRRLRSRLEGAPERDGDSAT